MCAQVALAPPEVQIDLQQQQEYEKQLQVRSSVEERGGGRTYMLVLCRVWSQSGWRWRGPNVSV